MFRNLPFVRPPIERRCPPLIPGGCRCRPVGDVLAGGLQKLQESGADNHGCLSCSNQSHSIIWRVGLLSQQLRKSQISVGANT